MDIKQGEAISRCPYCSGQLAPASQIERPVDYCHHDVVQKVRGYTVRVRYIPQTPEQAAARRAAIVAAVARSFLARHGLTGGSFKRC